ncbi:MAG: SRPBCC family protein [Alphaproteobacteria bacterium]|nr:SRPBCC family protein [Alphaproteobacteria bacterium]
MKGSYRLVTADLPRAAVFALVSDIEGYPAFVPGCVATRILAKDGATWTVDNVFGLGPVRARFTTTAQVTPPDSLDIVSRDGPWRLFEMRWRIEALPAGCAIRLDWRAEPRLGGLGQIGRLLLPDFERRVVEAFARRARALRPA